MNGEKQIEEMSTLIYDNTQSENAKKRQREGKIQVIEYGGEVHGLREWSLITGINQTTLQSRIRSGWSVERALTERVAK